MQDIIEIKNVYKRYKRRVQEEELKSYIKGLFIRKYDYVESIKNLSLNIKQGEMVALIGPNGAGKTTLIKILTGLIRPTSGTVKVLNKNPNKKDNQFLKDISVILAQKNQLWWDLSPIESFKLNQKIYQIDEKKFQNTLDDLVNLLEVKSILNSPVRNLSLGERMKCEIIACLLHEPKIIFLDEPTIGLDIVAKKNIREFIKSYCKKNKITVILTSHLIEDITSICERILILKKGQIVYDGAKADLTNDQTKDLIEKIYA